ncbi:MAG: tRNA pseudouridine(38-40) synthase TruA [Cytophagales bacterium]|nr:tRNA pseudouridine(38-40) synthase TruA [Armatimonadota bacterium]
MATALPWCFWSSSTTKERRTFRLKLEYDGTDFAGFQLQGAGFRTVQGELETTIERLSGEFSRVHGAGRTDAGVHALGQTAHFETGWSVPNERLALALNNALPGDLVVKSAAIAEPGFHSRFSATRRTYCYAVLNRQAPSALLGRFALHQRTALDLDSMRAGASHLLGTHDFAAFGQPSEPGRSTVRYVERLDIRTWKDCVLITVRGNAFLRQQVRAFVGTLLKVGHGRLLADEVARIRDGQDRAVCPPIAPAKGLCLVRVDYRGLRITG